MSTCGPLDSFMLTEILKDQKGTRQKFTLKDILYQKRYSTAHFCEVFMIVLLFDSLGVCSGTYIDLRSYEPFPRCFKIGF